MKNIPAWYKVDYARDRIGSDYACAARCLREVARHHSGIPDGRGFRSVDEAKLTWAASLLRRGEPLPPRLREAVTRRMPRYAAQVVREGYCSEANLVAAMRRDGWLAPGRIEAARRERRG